MSLPSAKATWNPRYPDCRRCSGDAAIAWLSSAGAAPCPRSGAWAALASAGLYPPRFAVFVLARFFFTSTLLGRVGRRTQAGHQSRVSKGRHARLLAGALERRVAAAVHSACCSARAAVGRGVLVSLATATPTWPPSSACCRGALRSRSALFARAAGTSGAVSPARASPRPVAGRDGWCGVSRSSQRPVGAVGATCAAPASASPTACSRDALRATTSRPPPRTPQARATHSSGHRLRACSRLRQRRVTRATLAVRSLGRGPVSSVAAK